MYSPITPHSIAIRGRAIQSGQEPRILYVTTTPPDTSMFRHHWVQFTLRLVRRPLGLPVFEMFFALLIGVGLLVALLLPLIHGGRHLVR
jgi:hypothetical protein